MIQWHHISPRRYILTLETLLGSLDSEIVFNLSGLEMIKSIHPHHLPPPPIPSMDAHFQLWDHFADPSGKFGAQQDSSCVGALNSRVLSPESWWPLSLWESVDASKGKLHTFFLGSWLHKSSLVCSSPLSSRSTFVCVCVSQLQLKLTYWSQSHSELEVKSVLGGCPEQISSSPNPVHLCKKFHIFCSWEA